MDKYIELMAYYWVDWQQTAIVNTRYSVVLAVLAFFIGTFIIAILKNGKIKKLQKQLDKAKTKQDELAEKQTAAAVQITGFEQQVESITADMKQKSDDASDTLQKEKDKHQSELSDKDELILKTEKTKQLEIDDAKAKLLEKNQLSEQLQGELNQQKENIAKFTEVKLQAEGLESQLSEATANLNLVKAELETEVVAKGELLVKIDKQEQSTISQIDRVLELENQLAGVSNTQELDLAKAQREAAEKKRQQQLEQEKKAAAIKAEAEAAAARATAAPAPTVEVVKEPVAPQPVPVIKPIQKQADNKKGIAAKVIGWFSSMDAAVGGDGGQGVVVEKPQQNSVKETIVPAAVVESVKEVVVPVVSEPVVKKVEVKPAPVTAPKVPTELLDESTSFSEKLAEAADKMDSMQDKLKGFFSKKKS